MENTFETEVMSMFAAQLGEVPGVPRLLGYKRNLIDGQDVLVMEHVGRYSERIVKASIIREVTTCDRRLTVKSGGRLAHSIHVVCAVVTEKAESTSAVEFNITDGSTSAGCVSATLDRSFTRVPAAV